MKSKQIFILLSKNLIRFSAFILCSLILLTSCTSLGLSTSMKKPSSTKTIDNLVTVTKENHSTLCNKWKGSPFYYKIKSIVPDGKIAFIGKGLFLIDPVTESIETIYPFDKVYGFTKEEGLAWSPDGKLLTFAIFGNGYMQMIADLPNGEICPLIDQRGRLISPVWSPNGNNIAVIDSDSSKITIINIYESRYKVLENEASPYSDLQWMNDSNIIFTRKGGSDHYTRMIIHNIDTGGEIIIIPNNESYGNFRISPDGQKLANTENIFIKVININLNTSYFINYNNPDNWEYNAIYPKEWSKDSQKLLAGGLGGGVYLYSIYEDKAIIITTSWGDCTSQAFSPDESMFVVNDIWDEKDTDSPIGIYNIKTNSVSWLNIPYRFPGDPVWNPNQRK